MNTFFLICLFIFWTMFGSFASVLIYRIKSGEGWIIAGKSHCKTCQRDLTSLELVPIFSWLFQWWKCKWCKEKISSIYPILELSMWVLFACVWFFLVDLNLLAGWSTFEIIKLLFFLSIMFLTIIYVFYDILYLEIPESVLLVANIWAFGALIAQDYGFRILGHIWHIPFDYSIPVVVTTLVCLSILGLLYVIMRAGLKEIYDILIVWLCMIILYVYISNTGWVNGLLRDSALLSGTLAAFLIYLSFFLQIVLSGGRWMWAWDLRIAILMWLLVWLSFAFPAWMITYLAGSIIGIWIILYSKIRHGFKADFQHQIPFGPFLACGYLAVLFFNSHIQSLLQWYL